MFTRHKSIIALISCLLLVITIFGASLSSVNASVNESPARAVIPGSVRCGTLHGWGAWRSTEDISTSARTVYFEPERTGTHKLQFRAVGPWASGIMDPYWSNDGKPDGPTKKWTGWSRVNYDIDTYQTNVDLRTDTTKTAYKFVFSGGPQGSVIQYRFYCK